VNAEYVGRWELGWIFAADAGTGNLPHPGIRWTEEFQGHSLSSRRGFELVITSRIEAFRSPSEDEETETVKDQNSSHTEPIACLGIMAFLKDIPFLPMLALVSALNCPKTFL
jgi:hypothetical protein